MSEHERGAGGQTSSATNPRGEAIEDSIAVPAATNPSGLDFLNEIWDCPMFSKLAENGKRVWRCACCPNFLDGTRPPAFVTHNATKVTYHANKQGGQGVRACTGFIPTEYAKLYRDLLSQKKS